jgi:alpha-1,2-mannosyltransferase
LRKALWGRPLLLVGLAELVALGLIVGLKVLDGLDFEVYRLGSLTWLQGGDPYGVLPATSRGTFLPFTYPPFAVLGFVPTTLLPARAGFLVLTVISALLLFAVVYGFLVALRGREKGLVLPGFVAVGVQLLAAGGDPVRSTLGYGQINMVLMALVVFDCLGPTRRWRGVLVGLAAAIKLTPAVFILFFLVRKDFRAALQAGVTFVAATALAFAVLPGESVTYWTKLLFNGERIGAPDHVANQSLRGAFARLSVDFYWILPALLVIALTVYVIRRSNMPMGLAITALCGLLVSPVSWVHHWVWLVPVLVVLGWTAVFERRVFMGLSVVLAAAVAISTPIWIFEFGGWDAGVWQQAVSDSYVLAGIVLLLVAVVYVRGNSTRRSSPPDGLAATPIDPPCALTTDATIDNPSPEPPDVAVRSSRRKGSNKPGSSSTGITGPLLITRSAGEPPTSTVTDPPGSL